MTDADFHIKKGTVRPALEVQLIGQDGKIPDIRTAICRFQMTKVGEDTPTVDSSVRIVDRDNAIVAYEWDDGDTDDPGTYLAEFQVDYDHQNTFENDEEFPNDGYIEILVEETL